MTLSEKGVLIWLSHIEGITNKDIKKILNYFDNITEVLNIDGKHIKKALIKRGIIADKIIKNRNDQFINKIFESLYNNNILPLTIFDKDYPYKLKNIYDPPYVIYLKGKKINFDIPLIAMVGSRKATPYGKWAAYQFARELAKYNIGIISGLALGIDASSHKGELDEDDGYTIGVLGCGLDQYYPASNRNLMDRMIEDGCIISEYCLGMPPLKYNFPARNRIISGLSEGVVVIEATEKSGALITVDYALDQGKNIYALPGNINSAQSKGTNKLIRDGAKALLSIDDIVEDLQYKYNIEKKSINKSTKEDLSEIELKIYKIIKSNPIDIEVLTNKTRMRVCELNPILTILEIKGYIEQMPGKIFTVSK